MTRRARVSSIPGPIGQRLRRLAQSAIAASLGACASSSPVGNGGAKLPPEADGGRVGAAAVGGGRAGSAAVGSGGTGPAAGSGGRTDAGGAAGFVLVAGQGGVGAQAGRGGAGNLDDGFAPVPCGSLLLVSSPLNLAQPVDYIALYTSYGPQYAPPQTMLVSDYGNACQSASDQAACNMTLAMLTQPNEDCAMRTSCRPFTVITTGDKVERQDDAASLVTWLGTIDTPIEAVLVAIQNQLMLTCSGSASMGESVGTEVKTLATGYDVRTDYESCGEGFFGDEIQVNSDGTTGAIEHVMTASSNCVVGRRPFGLCPLRALGSPTELGRFFADTAQLEAASVYAFARLARELTALGAPAALVIQARRSAREEVRHARLTDRLAARYGGLARAPQVARMPRRDAFAIARENAIEGCVRETFGALIAHHQAVLATDRVVATTMREIAADETRHAELAWQCAAWLQPQLSERERTSLAYARSQALHELERELQHDNLSPSARAHIGWPSASVQRGMLRQMTGALGLS
jgi:hypothetical protein